MSKEIHAAYTDEGFAGICTDPDAIRAEAKEMGVTITEIRPALLAENVAPQGAEVIAEAAWDEFFETETGLRGKIVYAP